MNEIKNIKRGDVFTDNYCEAKDNKYYLRKWEAIEDCQKKIINGDVFYCIKGRRMFSDETTVDRFAFNQKYLDTPYLKPLRITHKDA